MLTLLALVPAALASETALASELQELQADLGAAPMICVAGEDAEQLTRRTLRNTGQEDVLVVRIPTVGNVDAEVSRAMVAQDRTCALRVSPVAGGFDLTRHGACASGSQGLDPDGGGPVPAQTGPATRAVPDTPERGGDGAVGADSSEMQEPTEAEWNTREARYQRERLMLVDLPPDSALPSDVTWELVDGRGSSLSARTVASIAQDEDLTIQLDGESRRAKQASRFMLWSSAGLAALAPVPLLGVEGGAISANQDRAWTSVFFLATAGLTLALHRAPRNATRERQKHPALYVDGDMAEDIAVIHNHRLYGRLELASRPSPPETEPDTQTEPVAPVSSSSSNAEREPQSPEPVGPVVEGEADARGSGNHPDGAPDAAADDGTGPDRSGTSADEGALPLSSNPSEDLDAAEAAEAAEGGDPSDR